MKTFAHKKKEEEKKIVTKTKKTPTATTTTANIVGNKTRSKMSPLTDINGSLAATTVFFALSAGWGPKVLFAGWSSQLEEGEKNSSPPRGGSRWPQGYETAING